MKLLMTGAFNCTAEQKLNIEKLGCEVMFQQMENEPLSEEMYTADIVICNGLFLYNDLDKFKNLKFVQLTSAGLDRVPVEKMNEKGIVLHNARGVYSTPMAEWVLTGVLTLYKNTNAFYSNQQNHKWIKDRNVKELSGSTICIVGCGSVGTECAKLFKPFSNEMIAVDIVKPKSDLFDNYYTINNVYHTGGALHLCSGSISGIKPFRDYCIDSGLDRALGRIFHLDRRFGKVVQVNTYLHRLSLYISSYYSTWFSVNKL